MQGILSRISHTVITDSLGKESDLGQLALVPYCLLKKLKVCTILFLIVINRSCILCAKSTAVYTCLNDFCT